MNIAVLFLVLFALALSPPAAAKKKSKKTKAPRHFVIDTDLSITYDDNILNYSDADLDLLASDSGSAKFAIKSKDDWIIEPEIRAGYQGRGIRGRAASLILGYRYYGYANNDVRRYSRIWLEARQYVVTGGYGQLSIGYIPSYYYRNLLFKPPGSTSSIFMEAKFSKPSLAAEFGYDIRQNLKGSAAYIYQHKSFQKEFEYRDLNVHGIDLNAVWRAVDFIKLWGAYGFEFAGARGADMADTIQDVSYDAWDVTVGARYYSKFLRRLAPELVTSFKYRRINYQTDRRPDLFRRHLYYFGRNDNNYDLKLGTSCRMPWELRLELGYEFAQKKAVLPDEYPSLVRNIPEATALLESRLNYKSNSYTLRISRQF